MIWGTRCTSYWYNTDRINSIDKMLRASTRTACQLGRSLSTSASAQTSEWRVVCTEQCKRLRRSEHSTSCAGKERFLSHTQKPLECVMQRAVLGRPVPFCRHGCTQLARSTPQHNAPSPLFETNPWIFFFLSSSLLDCPIPFSTCPSFYSTSLAWPGTSTRQRVQQGIIRTRSNGHLQQQRSFAPLSSSPVSSCSVTRHSVTQLNRFTLSPSFALQSNQHLLPLQSIWNGSIRAAVTCDDPAYTVMLIP